MESVGECLEIILVIYIIRGVLGFLNFWIVFEEFFDYPSRKWKSTDWIWIIFYAIVMLAYRPVINYGSKYLYGVMIVLYFMRMIPFLWAKYGKHRIFLVIVLFYGNLIDCFAQNIRFLVINKMSFGGYLRSEADIAVTIAEALVFGMLMFLMLLKRLNLVKIYFTKLTVVEYVTLFLINLFYGVLEVALFQESVVSHLMRSLSVITFILLMALILHIIIVREENISMNNMIGNLKEPMKQITESYIEMNEKNTELRRFRHDTKNLLLALQLLIAEGQYEQAAEYINNMQEDMERTKIKTFDTGNFIADALLESKAKIAARHEITILAEGCIPANRVEDVDLVILISNLLDNAIEAAKKVDGDRWIAIQSILKKNIWIFSVTNSCINDVVIRNNYIETTKDNKEAHGFGLSNIERVIRTYGGRLQLSCENKVFVARATLMFTS